MGFLRAFAGRTIAGNKFLIFYAMFLWWVFGLVVGGVNFFKFVAYIFEEGFLDFTGDTNINFLTVAGFDNFGFGVVVFEYYAIFPDEFTINELVYFDDEAGEHSFGHEFIVVAQDEVISVVPGVVGLVGGEELGRNVSERAVGDFVAEFEFHHELETFIAHVGILIICPDFGEVGMGEASEIFLDFLGVEDFVDGSGAPFGF